MNPVTFTITLKHKRAVSQELKVKVIEAIQESFSHTSFENNTLEFRGVKGSVLSFLSGWNLSMVASSGSMSIHQDTIKFELSFWPLFTMCFFMSMMTIGIQYKNYQLIPLTLLGIWTWLYGANVWIRIRLFKSSIKSLLKEDMLLASEMVSPTQKEWISNPEKCPACGHTIAPSTVKCPDCGLWLS